MPQPPTRRTVVEITLWVSAALVWTVGGGSAVSLHGAALGAAHLLRPAPVGFGDICHADDSPVAPASPHIGSHSKFRLSEK